MTSRSASVGFPNFHSFSDCLSVGASNTLFGQNQAFFGTSNSGGSNNSVLIGTSCNPPGTDSLVVGRFNSTSGTNGALFLVGRGTAFNDKKNALEVYDDGRVIINEVQGDLDNGPFD